MAKTAVLKKAKSKTELLAAVSDRAGLDKKSTKAVLDSLADLVLDEVRATGLVNLLGLMKVKVISKPAQPAREGINPFTKQKQMFAAKPARKVIKVLALKSLKDTVS